MKNISVRFNSTETSMLVRTDGSLNNKKKTFLNVYFIDWCVLGNLSNLVSRLGLACWSGPPGEKPTLLCGTNSF